jgi:hypothetical protein
MSVTTTQAVIVRFKRKEFFPASDKFSVQLFKVDGGKRNSRGTRFQRNDGPDQHVGAEFSSSVSKKNRRFSYRTVKMKWLLVIVIAVLASGLVFYRMYRHDITAREAFIVAYEKFDEAPREASLRELDAKASVKISSLIKHDRELMSAMREIADTAEQELNNPNNGGLTVKRKAAYSRFQSFVAK